MIYRYQHVLLGFLLVLIIWALSLLGYCFWIKHWSLPQRFIAHSVQVQGQVINIPSNNRFYTRFMFQVKRFNHQTVHTRFRLSWYRGHPVIRLGQVWEFTVRVKPAHGLHNPIGFNYQRWLFLRGVRATGYVKQGHLIQPVAPWTLAHCRNHLLSIVDDSLKNSSVKGVITALILGSKANLDQSTLQVFQNTGTSHLIAISGLHIGLIALVFYWVGFQCWRYFPKLTSRFPAPRFAAISALLAALLYSLVAGLSLPTQRALIMITVLVGLEFFNIYWPIWLRLVVAFVFIVILEPLSILSASLWLSFLAVASIVMVSQKGLKQSKIKAWLKVQLSLFVVLLPVSLYCFQKISLSMFVANLVAVPWVSFLIVPLCFLGILLSFLSVNLSGMVFKLAAFCLEPLYRYLSWLHQVPHLVWYHVVNHLAWLFLAYVGIVLAFIFWRRAKYFIAAFILVICFLPLLLCQPASLKHGQIQLTVLDVGQGLATVIQTQHHTMVYDAGPKSFTGFDAGKSIVVPYLRYLHTKQLAMLMISHGDNDHIGGAKSILQTFKVQRVLTSIPSKLAPFAAQHCYRGQHWLWDGVQFKVLWPPRYQPYLGNNSSCVLHVGNGHASLLLTGDIQSPAEEKLKSVRADILVAPHHGSKTSSKAIFIRRVSPKLVIFSTGYYNRFHFPSPVVQKRYQQAGVRCINTAFAGATTLKLDTIGGL